MNTPHPSARLLPAAQAGTNSRSRLLISPIAGQANIERTDEGKDYGSIRGKIVAVGSGVISNIYQGLSGFGTTVIERLSSPVTVGGRTYQDVYYGEETGGGTPTVQAGESVQAGTEIAPGLGTGGIEVGFWDPSTGRAVDASSYSEGGPPTQAGQDFVTATGGGVGITRPGGQPAGQPAGGSGGGGSQLLQAYQTLRDMPRTAPASTKNPFQWWLASFTTNWGNLSTGSSSSDTGSGSPTAPPVTGSQKQQVQQVAQQFGLSPQTLWGIYGTESSFGQNPSTSSAGAEGPFQFLPSTWATYGQGGNINQFSDSLVAAARLLRALGANSNPASPQTIAAANNYNGNRGGSDPSTSYFQNVQKFGMQF